VSIVNQALGHIGAKGRITSLSEDSEEAYRASLAYEPCRDAELRQHDWNFARAYAALAPLDVPAVLTSRWSYAYAWPTGCLHARAVLPQGVLQTTPAVQWATPEELEQQKAVSAVPAPYEVIARLDATSGVAVGRMILCNLSPAILRYTARVEAEEVFDASFVMLLAWRLAVELAFPLTKKASVQQKVEQSYGYFSAEARTSDAQEMGPHQYNQQSTLLAY